MRRNAEAEKVRAQVVVCGTLPAIALAARCMSSKVIVILPAETEVSCGLNGWLKANTNSDQSNSWICMKGF